MHWCLYCGDSGAEDGVCSDPECQRKAHVHAETQTEEYDRIKRVEDARRKYRDQCDINPTQAFRERSPTP